MKASELLIQMIKEFEGCRLKAYKCPSGAWTIGYGHTLDVKQGMTITQEQADQFLREDLKRFENAVNKLYPTTNQGQFDALVDFCYNAGYANLAKSTLLSVIKSNGSYEEIYRLWMQWTKATDPKTKQKVELPGLVKRRQWECDRFFSNY